MKLKPIYLLPIALCFIAGLYFIPKRANKKPSIIPEFQTQLFDIEAYTLKLANSLPATKSKKLIELRKNFAQDTASKANANALLNYSKDSLKSEILYGFYLSKASLLDNSKKTLTFAARFMLNSLQLEDSIPIRLFKTDEAIKLFEAAYVQDTTDKQLLVEKGSCYIYGHGMAGNANQTMKGVLLLRDLAKQDSLNMEVQLLLGIGGVVSNQYDKAIPRLLKVVNTEPNNEKAISWLADAYANQKNNKEAIFWYEKLKKINTNKLLQQEIQNRINILINN